MKNTNNFFSKQRKQQLFNVLCLSSGAVAEGSRFKVRTGETKATRREGDRGCEYAYKRGCGKRLQLGGRNVGRWIKRLMAH